MVILTNFARLDGARAFSCFSTTLETTARLFLVQGGQNIQCFIYQEGLPVSKDVFKSVHDIYFLYTVDLSFEAF